VGSLLVQGKYQEQQQQQQHHDDDDYDDDYNDDDNDDDNNNNATTTNIAVLRTCVVGTTPAPLNVQQYLRS